MSNDRGADDLVNVECGDGAHEQVATEGVCADAATAIGSLVAIASSKRPPRRMPAPERVAEATALYRRLLFPEVWTHDAAPTANGLVELCNALHRLLLDLLYAERMARPSRVRVATPHDTPRAREVARSWARQTSDAVIAALPAIREVLEQDLEAFLDGDPAARSKAEVILCYPGFHAIQIYRLAHELWAGGALLVARLMTEQVHGRTGIDLHPGATVGPAFFIDHGTGVVVGETAIIGREVRLYQGVTIGARSIPKAGERRKGKRHPTIEDGAIIYANATILGGDTLIGHGAIVGGNAWVTTSVPPGARMRIDVPARVAEAVVMVPDGAQPE